MNQSLSDRGIEILNPHLSRGKFRHVLFDFDGTLSLIREGWQDVMVPMMLEVLRQTGTGETDEQLEGIVREFVARLTGKQTIYQMIELAEQVKRRGGKPMEPLQYKHEYLDRLEARIQDRVRGLEEGAVDPETLLVPGSRDLLENLRRRSARLYLASGTDEPFVLREAKLLKIDHYFDGGIRGAMDNYKTFSKQMVIDRIIGENGLRGPELLGIGDGYVEIENTKSVGGIAFGLPTYEADPHHYDEWKRERLKQAGADILAPNLVCQEDVIAFLYDD